MNTQATDNQSLSQLMTELAAVLEALGDNPFKIRAYKNAAETIAFLEEPVVSIWERGELTKVKGIGKAIAEKIGDILEHGESEEVEAIKSRVPAAMFTLLPLEGLGPKKAYRLTTEFNLNNPNTVIEDLKGLIKQDAIAQLEGFGQKSQQVVLQALERYNPEAQRRMRIDEADTIANELLSYLKQCDGIEKISALGSLRRRKSTIGDIDIGVATTKSSQVIEYIKGYTGIAEILVSGDELVRFIHKSGANVDIKLLDPSMWGALLQHFTGSKQHNVALRERALNRGVSLSEHGIKKVNKPQAQLTDKQKAAQSIQTFEDEVDFYKAMDLDWISPEMREDSGEIELSEKHKLPTLVKLNDLNGEFHTHTNYQWESSHDYGENSPEEIVKKAIELGYSYIGVGDHNPKTTNVADKKNTNSILNRAKYVNTIAEKFKTKIKVFNSLEIDIKPDGDLAIPLDSLVHIDVPIISIHSSMNQSPEQITQRLIRALSVDGIKILAHPTGRQINKRDGYDCDWLKIFKLCADKNIAIEINANPHRLDLPETLAKQAAEVRVKLVINSDAHQIAQMDYLQYGIDIARRAGLSADQILNTWDVTAINKWLVD